MSTEGYLQSISDEELVSFPELIRAEKERRETERLCRIPNEIIKKLQKQLRDFLVKLQDQPDVRTFKVKVTSIVSYILEDDQVLPTITSDDQREFDFGDEENNILLSKSIKARAKRLQKTWDNINRQVNELSDLYRIPRDVMWSIIDSRGEL